ncbi:hypothetical protein D9758_013729 [Tetrapyrgos nigripes]|uniref:DUF6532 domain-containing protein n=1 Tax=Tetrapyrgos nigripes TaxID=182062 RepID=A0A8H5LG20_9AGAR|nr:hypothetical protein D9758_013729 [Tetrapyrgos nigripes]
MPLCWLHMVSRTMLLLVSGHKTWSSHIHIIMLSCLPFEHPALSKYISAMFFGTHAYATFLAKNKHVFVSSSPTKTEELELPKALVVFSVAAIHSILSDFARQCNENFPSKELGSVWKSVLAILNNVEKVNRVQYHTLMHKLYVDTSGSLTSAGHVLSNDQIFNTVDWAAFVDSPTQTSQAGPSTSVALTTAATTTSPTATLLLTTGTSSATNITLLPT